MTSQPSLPKDSHEGMASWLIALSGHCSWVDNVLISVAILALTKMADVSDPWLPRYEVLMCIVILDGTTLKDQPSIWHHTLCGTPMTGANGLGSLEIGREHPHVIN